MIAPLKATMDMSLYLFKNLDNQHYKHLSEMIYITSNMIFLHAQDLLDKRLIETGGFIPCFTSGSITKTIKQMVLLMQQTLNQGS